MKRSPVRLMLFCALIIGTFVAGASLLPHQVSASDMPQPQAILAYVNAARVANGLPAFTSNTALMQAGNVKAIDLAKQGELVHTTAPAGVAWSTLANAHYMYSSAGENLAANILDPQTLVNDWMNSPAHRANILDPHFVDAGVGVAEGVYKGIDTDFVVLYVAEPKPVATEVTHSANALSTNASVAQIKSMITYLSNYLLALTAQKAEAYNHP